MNNHKRIRKIKSAAIRALIYISAAMTIMLFISILGYIIVMGFKSINLRFLFGGDGDKGLMPMLIVTMYMVAISLLISVPIGISAAIYLVEYAKKGSRLVKIVRITTESLAGIPSIIFGLFGFLFFVTALGWSWSLLSGAMTLSIMVLPTIIRTTEEALISVPDPLREGSFGLGAGKLRTVFKVVLPYSLRGILSGIILSIGRIVGETAAVIFTAGTMMRIPDNVFQSARTLSVHMYLLASEGGGLDTAFGTALVLIVAVIFTNMSAKYIANKMQKG